MKKFRKSLYEFAEETDSFFIVHCKFSCRIFKLIKIRENIVHVYEYTQDGLIDNYEQIVDF